MQLSYQSEAAAAYFNDETLESHEIKLNRDHFNAILQEHGFFEQLDESMTQVLRQARRQGVEVSDIDAVLLVGGTVQIPAVQAWVRQYFEQKKICSEQPFEAIAQGALQLSQGVEINDFLYHGYGIRYWNWQKKCHDWHSLILEGQPYPMSKPVELVLGASSENQAKIELVIGELGTQSRRTEVFFDGDRLITRTIASLPGHLTVIEFR